MLGQAGLIVLHGWLVGPRAERGWKAVAFVIFFAAVLFSDQRTATLATIAGAITVLSFVPRRRDTTISCLGLIACAAGVGVVALASLSDGQLTEYLPRSLQMIVLQEGTFAWRLDQWQIYFQQWVDAAPFDQIIGQPLGLALAIGLRFSTLTELAPLALPAHSEYLQLLLNVGVIGLATFLLVPVSAFIDAIFVSKVRQRLSAPVILAIAILASQLVFSFSYSLDNVQGLLLAISVQVIAVAREASGRLGVGQVHSPRAQLPIDFNRRFKVRRT
jgi:hypothetical protein